MNYNDYSCPCFEDKPDTVDSSCSVNSIRETFLQIIKTIRETPNPFFNVNVSITTKNGIVTTVNFSKLSLDDIVLNSSTLVIDGVAFSLCDVVKITIDTSSIIGTTFHKRLLQSLKNITTTAYYPNDNNDNYDCGCSSTAVECAQCMQNYINQNMGSIEKVSYTGGFSTLENITAPENITKTNVLDSATIIKTKTDVLKDVTLNNQVTPVLQTANLSTQKASVLNSATLNTQPKSVVEDVSPSDTEIVEDITLNTDLLVSSVTPSSTEVAAPLNIAPTNVVSNVQTEENEFVENIQVGKGNVISQISSTNAPAIVSFDPPTTVNGVISGVTTPKTVVPELFTLSKFKSDGIGPLTITIPQKTITPDYPTTDLVFSVKVNGQDIEFNGSTDKFVLSDNTNLIGYSVGDPTSVNIQQMGVPQTEIFLKSITPTTQSAVTTVVPKSSVKKFVADVSNVEINNVQNPTIKSVVEDIDTNQKDITSIANVSKVNVRDLFDITSTDVVGSATLNTTNEEVVSSATLNTTAKAVLSSSNLIKDTENIVENVNLLTSSTSVVEDITEKQISVLSPVNEDINGNIVAAGDGIMAVNNSNGDISVYSTCDINTLSD